jgi:SET domain-containing protein
MKTETNEFSFVLKPSEYGIGVFAVHDIKIGTYLRLFGEENDDRAQFKDRLLNKKDIPEAFLIYGIDRDASLSCPADFGCMPIGWYLNHSQTPNAAHRDYNYYAVHDIRAGEEILIDYNTLEEPEEAKEDYYKVK